MIRPSFEPGRRPWIAGGLRLVLAFGLLAIVVHANRAQVRAVAARPVDPGLFAIGLGAYLAGLLLAFLRWYLLVRVLGLPFRVRDALRLGFIGNLFNLVIPGAVGGDVIKAAYLCREQERKARAVASIVVDRVAGLLGLFGLAGLTGLLAWGRLDPAAHRLVACVVALLLVSVGAIALSAGPSLRARREARPPGGARRTRRREELAAAASSYRRRPGALVLALALALVTHGLNVLAFDAADVALFRPAQPSIAEHAVIVPLVLFSTAVPLPLSALGLSEEVSAQLFRLVHFDGGAVGMMAFRLLQYAGAAIGALVYLPNRRRVRAMVEAGELVAAGASGMPDGR